MDLLNTCLIKGAGICFQSKQEFDELLRTCFQLGYDWHWSVHSFSTYTEERFIRLNSGYLFWGSVKNRWSSFSLELHDWNDIKSRPFIESELRFMY